MSGYFFRSERQDVDVEVDLSSQVLELEVDEQESYWAFPVADRRPLGMGTGHGLRAQGQGLR